MDLFVRVGVGMKSPSYPLVGIRKNEQSTDDAVSQVLVRALLQFVVS